MGNKTKPSSLWLVPSHHDFDSLGTLFEPEMLEWPICGYSFKREPLDEKVTRIYRGTLEGLMNIGPFEAKISLEIDSANKRLLHPKRVWGKIYLNNEYIISFSHDTRFDSAFYNLVEWTEKDDDWMSAVSWTTDQWSEFFIERIKREAIALKTKSEAKRNDAITLENRAIDLLLALSQ